MTYLDLSSDSESTSCPRLSRSRVAADFASKAGAIADSRILTRASWIRKTNLKMQKTLFGGITDGYSIPSTQDRHRTDTVQTQHRHSTDTVAIAEGLWKDALTIPSACCSVCLSLSLCPTEGSLTMQGTRTWWFGGGFAAWLHDILVASPDHQLEKQVRFCFFVWDCLP